MKVAVRGTQERIDELKTVLSSEVAVVEFKGIESLKKETGFTAVIDLNFEEHTSDASALEQLDVPVFVNSVLVNLHEFFQQKVYGINALPTFLSRSTLELNGTKDVGPEIIELVEKLGWESTEIVACRVGMVTPRVICMIINEAFYTVQEGTATKEDIDKGMKLGTAYPMGPFEWSEKMGVDVVYKVLDAMWQDTREERYKICPMLKTAYLQKR